VSASSKSLRRLRKEDMRNITKWQQKDGTWINLKDMSKKHLVNALELLKRTENVPVIVEADDHDGELIYKHDDEMIEAIKSELRFRD
jgi:hypothetical protein